MILMVTVQHHRTDLVKPGARNSVEVSSRWKRFKYLCPPGWHSCSVKLLIRCVCVCTDSLILQLRKTLGRKETTWQPCTPPNPHQFHLQRPTLTHHLSVYRLVLSQRWSVCVCFYVQQLDNSPPWVQWTSEENKLLFTFIWVKCWMMEKAEN